MLLFDMKKGLSIRVGVLAGSLLLGTCLAVPRFVYAQDNPAVVTEIRFQQLEKELRRLTGQIESQQYEIRQLRGQMSSLPSSTNSGVSVDIPRNVVAGADLVVQSAGIVIEGADNDLSSYGQYRQGANAVGSPSSVFVASDAVEPPPFENSTVQTLGTYTKPAGKDVGETVKVKTSLTPTGSEKGDYDQAYSYIKARDFDMAERAFSLFMQSYPDSELVSNAKYWHGETFYVRGMYEKAARSFAEGYQGYPNGSKAPSNLLKLGMALVGMGKSEDACIAFKQLKKDYAGSSVPVLKRAEVEMSKANCQ